MAIQGSYNLDNALSSQAYAYKCWYNYNYGNNTMGISASDMGEITQTWSGELSNWRATASDDENAYEIEDDDFSNAYNKGQDTAQDKTGYEGGGKGKMATRSAADLGLGVTGALSTTIGSNVASNVGKAITGDLIGKTGAKLAGKATTKAAQQTADKVGSANGSWIVAAPLALTQGTLYMAKKPNKDQKEACDELLNEMTNSQNALTAAQGDMQTYSDEVIALSDEAAVYNEDANENVEENKAEYDMYRASYDALMEKVEAGETLSEDEKALLEELIPLMQELGVTIEETSTDTTDAVSEIYDEMGTYQEGYDNAAATMAEVQGVTDFAESFDEATKTNCVVEAVAQGLNAASGTKAGIQATSFAASGSWAFGATSWAFAFAAMGFAGAGMSVKGTVQQAQWAGDVGTEIDMRRATQDFNAQTTEVYDESIDGYEGTMGTVEDLSMAIPEDIEEMTEEMEIPEEAPQIPAEGGSPAAGAGLGLGVGTGNNGNNGAGTSTRGLGLGVGAGNNSSNGVESGARGLGLGAGSGENSTVADRNGLGQGTSPDGKDDKDKDKPVV